MMRAIIIRPRGGGCGVSRPADGPHEAPATASHQPFIQDLDSQPEPLHAPDPASASLASTSAVAPDPTASTMLVATAVAAAPAVELSAVTLVQAAPAPATAAAPVAAGPLAAALPPHFGPEALLESVESGAIAPLRGSWLVALHGRGGTLQRRQDLPPEAFFSAAELRKLVAALGEDYGLLFVALSYRCAPRGRCPLANCHPPHPRMLATPFALAGG